MKADSNLTWNTWKKLFIKGRTPATYFIIPVIIIFIYYMFLYRLDLQFMVYSFTGSLVSYAVLTDQVAHLLTVNSYAGYKNISQKHYIILFFRFREHDQYGMIIVFIMAILLRIYFIIPFIAIVMYLMYRARFYH